MNPLAPRPTVEVSIKAEDRPDPVPLHDCDVDAIAGGHQNPILNDLACPQNVCLFDRKNIVYDIQRQLVGRPNRLSFSDGGVPMHDLPKHFSIGDEALP